MHDRAFGVRRLAAALMRTQSGGKPPHSEGGSIFGKLFAIMLVMAVCLMALVTWFFFFSVAPALDQSAAPFIRAYIQRVAEARPTLAQAKRMTSGFDLGVRYEGPDGTWSTSRWLPPVAKAQLQRSHLSFGSEDYVVRLPDGRAYLFRWQFRQKTMSAHALLLLLLLALMTATIIVTYLALRWLLRPVRLLGDGVARLSAGELDVVLPPTRDELGAVTVAFNEMVGRVREMIRARDRLLLDVSHELRSPLTRIRVAIELLPEGRERDGMVADVAEMEAMIAELLELERLREGRGLRIAPADLAPVVRDVVAAFPSVRLLSLPSTLPADADAEKIRIVLRNLVENAVKYSLPDSAPVEISAAIDNEQIVIRVTDDGPGVPEADRASLFEPFYRVDRARSKTPAGYGLGLSICKRIVEAHGGTIALQPHTGRGTTFVITLPRRQGR